MKTKKKGKTQAKSASRRTPIGLQKTKVLRRAATKEEESRTFSAQETGRPDATPYPDSENPAGVQGGRGPLNQEGEGDRQNAQLAELETIEPDVDNQ